MKYYFSVFDYNTDQKILSCGHKPIEMTKKSHELLQFLLENPERLIARESLIEHVWHGRVVTNNTIDQCIMKLRKILNQAHPDEYIESIYGQGIRFLPNISTHEHQQVSMGDRPTQSAAITLVVMLLFLSTWLVFNQTAQKTNETITQTPHITVSNQTQFQPKTSAGDWLTLGATNYLSYLLNQHPEINTLKPRTTHSNDRNLLTIDLQTSDSGQHSLSTYISGQQNTASQTQYRAEMNLLKNNEVNHSQTFVADKLTSLYPQLAGWTMQQLVQTTSHTSNAVEVFTENEVALKNYLQGMLKQKQGDSQQALSLLTVAVETDPQFKMAWYEMAIAIRKQGDPNKAISILKAIDTDDPHLSYRVALVMAQCLDSVGEFATAEQTYLNAWSWAEVDQDPAKMAAVLISQAILYRKTQRYDLAEQVLEQASTVTDSDTQPQLYGTIMNTHAKLAKAINKPLVAIEKAQLAIKSFQQSGDVRYQMQAKTVLASILRQRNEFSQAEKLVKESLFHAEQLGHRRGISDNRTKLARIYQQTGRFQLAYDQWQLVLGLNEALSLYTNSADAYWWLLHLHLAENNLTQADIDLKMLAQLYQEHPNDEIKQLWYEAQLIMALEQNAPSLVQSLLYELASSEYPLLPLYRGDHALLVNMPEEAEMHYLEALVMLHDSGRYDWLSTTLNRLNALYTEYNTHKLADNLVRSSRLKPFIYPLQKYQAIAAYDDNKHIQAISLMEELKLKSGDYWQATEQKLLQQFRSSESEP